MASRAACRRLALGRPSVTRSRRRRRRADLAIELAALAERTHTRSKEQKSREVSRAQQATRRSHGHKARDTPTELQPVDHTTPQQTPEHQGGPKETSHELGVMLTI